MRLCDRASGQAASETQFLGAGRTYSKEDQMTAIKSAMKKAGVKTDAYELYTAATQVIKNHGGVIDKALNPFVTMLIKKRELMDTLALDYLQKTLNDMTAAAAADGRSAPAKPLIKYAEQAERTPAQKAAATRAMNTSVLAVAIYERRLAGKEIGKLKWRELPAIAHQCADRAVKGLLRDVQDVRDSLVAQKLLDRMVVTDETAGISDVVKPDVLLAIINECDMEAPTRIADAMNASKKIFVPPHPVPPKQIGKLS
jgi:hypothetical protein